MESISFDWEHPAHIIKPYIMEMKSFTPDAILFNGYFYIEDTVMPIERLLYTEQGLYHVEIYEKKTLDDTSEYSYDEEIGGNVCFFPTAMIELKYRILNEVTKENRESICDRIASLETEVYKKHRQHLEERSSKEHEEFVKRYNEMYK
jgi:hypothetical protein